MNKPTLLIVDDEPANLKVLTALLSDKYRIRAANSGARALKAAISEPRPELILLDIMMPEMDGYEVLARLKADPATREIPVIFVTARESEEDEAYGLGLGAVDYLTKPVRPTILQARVRNHLILKQASDFLQDKNDFLQTEVVRRMEENQIVQDASIRALAHLAEPGDHINRTRSYVQLLAERLKDHPRFRGIIDDRFIELITQSAPLHDIGKVGIPDNILLKPGKLTAEEWAIMQTHADMGARAIEYAEQDVQRPVAFLQLAKEIAHWHHERWDGSGYPDGLKGDDIPLAARLMALADVFDALISQRVYKPPMPFEEARDLIVAERGHHFDPDLVDAFSDCFAEFVGIARRYDGGTQQSLSKRIEGFD
jgi:putative two-component system response regulator